MKQPSFPHLQILHVSSANKHCEARVELVECILKYVLSAEFFAAEVQSDIELSITM